jgi:1,2-phenylacetyl-CoA epoxidase PaaB subunit
MARYQIFARREYEKPLSWQGTLEAGDADGAAEEAQERFGDWLEVRLVPEVSVRWIVGPLPPERRGEGEREEDEEEVAAT